MANCQHSTTVPTPTPAQPIERRVAAALRAASGWTVTYEYPGYLAILAPDGTRHATGRANATWTVDHYDETGDSLIGSSDTGIACDSTDVTALVVALRHALVNAPHHTEDSSHA